MAIYKILLNYNKIMKSILKKILSIKQYKSPKKNISKLDLTEVFSSYLPASAGSYKMYEKFIKENINSVIPLLAQLSENFNQVKILNINELDLDIENANKLGSLFKKYRSDKSTTHNYHLVYSFVISKLKDRFVLLEIGLGSNNVDIISNMGKGGNPGASIFAFKDMYPNGEIYGADIDDKINLEASNIKTYFVDQADQKTFNDLAKKIGKKFDLIIDDGLHSQFTNLNTLIFALENLNKDGYLIIEDIPEYALDTWKIVANIIPTNFSFLLIKTKVAFVGLLKKEN